MFLLLHFLLLFGLRLVVVGVVVVLFLLLGVLLLLLLLVFFYFFVFVSFSATTKSSAPTSPTGQICFATIPHFLGPLGHLSTTFRPAKPTTKNEKSAIHRHLTLGRGYRRRRYRRRRRRRCVHPTRPY